jgi:hypothetical protein
VKRLFTFVMEHKGASSVSQVLSTDARRAVREWVRGAKRHVGDLLSVRELANLKRSLDPDPDPVPVDGRPGVWATTAITGKQPGSAAFFVIVATCRGRTRPRRRTGANRLVPRRR